MPHAGTMKKSDGGRRRGRRARRWLVAAVLIPALPVAAYGVLYWWFISGSPKITRNFAAELNRATEAVPESERGWPLYREAYGKLERLRPATDQKDVPDLALDFGEVRPGHAAWTQAREYVGRNGEAITLIRRATEKPRLGWVLSAEGDPVFRALREAPAPPGPVNPNPPIESWDLSHLTPLRYFARTLRADIWVAAEAGEGERVFADLLALLRMADHARETPLILGDLVSLVVLDYATGAVGDILQEFPGLLSDGELTRLDEQLRRFAGGPIPLRLEAERMTYKDMLQRCYTDDGKGDGHLTEAGLRLVGEGMAPLDRMAGGSGDAYRIAPILRPWHAAISPSRKEVASEFERLLGMIERDWAVVPWQRTWESLAECARLKASPKGGLMDLAPVVIRGLHSMANNVDWSEQERDAALVVIALERFRLAHARYPESLGELAPEFLAAVPVDRHDGKAVRYRCERGVPLLYSVGSDGDDDGGRPPAVGTSRFKCSEFRLPAERDLAPDADWILWPVPRLDEPESP